MKAPHLSLSTEAGGFVFVSGQLAIDKQYSLSGSDIAAQTTRTLQNIADVLAHRQLTLADVVKTNVWLKNAADFLGFDESYAQAFGENRPARSTVISDLVLPGALVEIEVIARVRS